MRSRSPFVTVVTPSLNYGRYIGECLASVHDQIGVTVEHIVMDGGSSDETQEVVSSFPLAIFINERDKGISDAINRGFDRARGEWVMWLNADDRLKPGALAELVEAAMQNPEADLIYGAFDFIDEKGAFIRRIALFDWSQFVSVHHCCYLPTTASFIRRKTVIEEGYRLREDFRYVMDGEFHARLDAAGKTFCYLPVVLADFRLHSGNRSLSTVVNSRDMNEAFVAEMQHTESRAIRRVHGFTFTADPYLNGLTDGLLYILARILKILLKIRAPKPRLPTPKITDFPFL